MMRTSGTARLDEKGRLLLPADYRRRLRLQPGDEVSITEEDGMLRVESRSAAARSLIGLAGTAGSRSSLEDLREMREEEARIENQRGSAADSVRARA